MLQFNIHGNAFMRFAVRCTMQSTVFECSTNNCVNLNKIETKKKKRIMYISESSYSARRTAWRSRHTFAERDSMFLYTLEKCMFIQASRTHEFLCTNKSAECLKNYIRSDWGHTGFRHKHSSEDSIFRLRTFFKRIYFFFSLAHEIAHKSQRSFLVPFQINNFPEPIRTHQRNRLYRARYAETRRLAITTAWRHVKDAK